MWNLFVEEYVVYALQLTSKTAIHLFVVAGLLWIALQKRFYSYLILWIAQVERALINAVSTARRIATKVKEPIGLFGLALGGLALVLNFATFRDSTKIDVSFSCVHWYQIQIEESKYHRYVLIPVRCTFINLGSKTVSIGNVNPVFLYSNSTTFDRGVEDIVEYEPYIGSGATVDAGFPINIAPGEQVIFNATAALPLALEYQKEYSEARRDGIRNARDICSSDNDSYCFDDVFGIPLSNYVYETIRYADGFGYVSINGSGVKASYLDRAIVSEIDLLSGWFPRTANNKFEVLSENFKDYLWNLKRPWYLRVYFYPDASRAVHESNTTHTSTGSNFLIATVMYIIIICSVLGWIDFYERAREKVLA